MNGWQRIGVVLSVITGLPTFLVAYADHASAFGSVYPSEATLALKGQEFWNEVYREAEAEQPEKFKDCVASTIEMRAPVLEYDRSYSVACDKTMVSATKSAIPFAAIPIALIWAFGWTVAWVRAGFRRPKP